MLTPETLLKYRDKDSRINDIYISEDGGILTYCKDDKTIRHYDLGCLHYAAWLFNLDHPSVERDVYGVPYNVNDKNSLLLYYNMLCGRPNSTLRNENVLLQKTISGKTIVAVETNTELFTTVLKVGENLIY